MVALNGSSSFGIKVLNGSGLVSSRYLTDVSATDQADCFFFDAGRLVFMSSSQLRVYSAVNGSLGAVLVNLSFANSSIYLTDCKLRNDSLIYSVNSSVFVYNMTSQCYTVNYTSPTYYFQSI